MKKGEIEERATWKAVQHPQCGQHVCGVSSFNACGEGSAFYTKLYHIFLFFLSLFPLVLVGLFLKKEKNLSNFS